MILKPNEEIEKLIAELKEYREKIYKLLVSIYKITDLSELGDEELDAEISALLNKTIYFEDLIDSLGNIINILEKRLDGLRELSEKLADFSDNDAFADKYMPYDTESVSATGRFGMGKSSILSDALANAGAPGNDSPFTASSTVNGNDSTAINNVKISQVQFSAVAPKTFIKDEYTMLGIYMYEEDFRSVVEDALKKGKGLEESRSGFLSVEDKTNVSIELSSPDIEIDDNYDEQVWSGKYLKFDFAVSLPEDYNKKQILFIAKIYFNGVPATRLKFIAKVKTFREQKMDVLREDVLSAFISYASQDRSRVAAIIQGMKKARPEIDIFFDVENLRSGDDWEKALMTEISRRDILFLCWSLNARASEWVDREWRYALSSKGLDGIEPIPIDPPDLCPPPKELVSKHFNDRELLYMERSKEAAGSVGFTEQNIKTAFLMRCKNNELITVCSEDFVIGRDAKSADYVISDNPRISRVHGKIQYEDGRYNIVDLNSSNGTYVNGVRISPETSTVLTDRCEIMFADEKYRFFLP